jgi:small subunit ribosomal protein S17
MPRRVMDGRVVSDKMQKTVVVEVVSSKRHPLYHKVMRMQRRFMAHDEEGTAASAIPSASRNLVR